MIRRTRTESGNLVAGLALAALAAGTLATPASADWLVTKDGARLETKGAWRVEGRQVIFDLPNGTLSTIRVDEVDLDRSAVETAEARAVASSPTPVVAPKKEPVLRLTEKDIPPSGEAEEANADGEAAKSGEEVAATLEVISWEKTENGTGDGVEIFGTIRNNGANMILSPSLMVAIYDSDGGLLATNNGVVNSPQIAAGKTANFRVTFSGLTDFASAKFDAQGRGFKQRTESSTLTEEEQDAVAAAEYDTESEPVTEEEPPEE